MLIFLGLLILGVPVAVIAFILSITKGDRDKLSKFS